MRVVALFALLVLLAGCASDVPSAGPAGAAAAFDDLDVTATDTKGILLGVVVDAAIRPIDGAVIALALPDGSKEESSTDDQGRFAFGDLDPGTYFLAVSHALYLPVQASAEVVAGEDDPPVLRVQLERLFSQDPYSELIAYDGYLACAYSVGISSTCVNDYTRLIGFVPGCEGGCLKDYNVSQTGGNIREYTATVGAGWQVLVFEMTWTPTVQGLGESLGVTVSYFNRTSTGHWYASESQPNPLRMQVNVGEPGPNQNEEPTLIPPEGMNDLFVFFGAGDLAVNQRFQSFETHFHYGLPPDDWSFVNNDPMPF